VVGLVLFLVVRTVSRLHKKEEAAPAEPPPQEKLLIEIRDLLKERRPR
jgi:large conductance mechanosensitive channel